MSIDSDTKKYNKPEYKRNKEKDKIFTKIFGEAQTFIPQTLAYDSNDPMALKAAQLLMRGSYHGHPFSLKDFDVSKVNEELAIQQANDLHRIYHIPVEFVPPNDPRLTNAVDESKGIIAHSTLKEGQIIYQPYERVTAFYRLMVESVVSVIRRRIQIAILQLYPEKLNFSLLEKGQILYTPADIQDFFTLYPEIQLFVQERINQEMDFIEDDARDFRTFLIGGYGTDQKMRKTRREEEKKILAKIKEKLKETFQDKEQASHKKAYDLLIKRQVMIAQFPISERAAVAESWGVTLSDLGLEDEPHFPS